MAITTDFIDAVKEGKIIRTRIMLKDSLLVDPTAAQFEEMEHYAVTELDDLYMQHNGEKLNFDSTSWNENYLNEQMVIVVNNFSKQRIALLKSMVRHLYKEKTNKIEDERDANRTSKDFSRRQVGTGVAIAGGAVVVAGVVTSSTALTIGGVVVAAVGASIIISDKGSK